MKLNYEEVLNSLPILVYVSLSDGIETIFYNSSWRRYTGFTLEEMKHGWEDVVHPYDIKRILDIINNAVSTKSTYTVEFRLFNKYFNDYRWVIANCHPVLTPDNEIMYWVGYISDIHDAKITSNELKLQYDREASKRIARIKELEQELELHRTSM